MSPVQPHGHVVQVVRRWNVVSRRMGVSGFLKNNRGAHTIDVLQQGTQRECDTQAPACAEMRDAMQHTQNASCYPRLKTTAQHATCLREKAIHVAQSALKLASSCCKVTARIQPLGRCAARPSSNLRRRGPSCKPAELSTADAPSRSVRRVALINHCYNCHDLRPSFTASGGGTSAYITALPKGTAE